MIRSNLSNLLFKHLNLSTGSLFGFHSALRSSQLQFSQLRYNFCLNVGKITIESLFTKHGISEQFFDKSQELYKLHFLNKQFHQALKVEEFRCQKVKQIAGEASNQYVYYLASCGALMQKINMYQQAKQAYLRAHTIFQKLDLKQESVALRMNFIEIDLAKLLYFQGKYSQAQYWFNKSESNESFSEKQISNEDRFIFYQNFGMNSLKVNERHKAHQCFLKCYQMIKQGQAKEIKQSIRHQIVFATATMELENNDIPKGVKIMLELVKQLDSSHHQDSRILMQASDKLCSYRLFEYALLPLEKILAKQGNDEIYFEAISQFIEICIKLRMYEKAYEKVFNFWQAYQKLERNKSNLLLVDIKLKEAHICHLINKREQGLKSLKAAQTQASMIPSIYTDLNLYRFECNFNILFETVYDEYASESQETEELLMSIQAKVESKLIELMGLKQKLKIDPVNV